MQIFYVFVNLIAFDPTLAIFYAIGKTCIVLNGKISCHTGLRQKQVAFLSQKLDKNQIQFLERFRKSFLIYFQSKSLIKNYLERKMGHWSNIGHSTLDRLVQPTIIIPYLEALR